MARTERGAAAVELAIVLPLLFLVIAGIVDFGRFFFTEIQTTNAAREGARIAAVLPSPAATPASDPMVQAPLRASSAAAGVPGGISVGVTPCATGATTNATVVVSATFQWILLDPAARMLGGSWGIPTGVVSTGVMRCGG